MNFQLAHCSIGLTGEATGIRRTWEEWGWKYSVFRPCQRIQGGFSAGMLLFIILRFKVPLLIGNTNQSSTILLISDRWNCLGDDIIEAVECLKSWSIAGFGFAGIGSEIKEMENTLKALEVYSLGQG